MPGDEAVYPMVLRARRVVWPRIRKPPGLFRSPYSERGRMIELSYVDLMLGITITWRLSWSSGFLGARDLTYTKTRLWPACESRRAARFAVRRGRSER